jgi:hypothetical protein
LPLVQFIVSLMDGRSPKIAVKFAIPEESKYSGLCWLNLFCANKHLKDDSLWPVGAIRWITSHHIMTLRAYIDRSRVNWDLKRSLNSHIKGIYDCGGKLCKTRVTMYCSFIWLKK